MIYKRGDVLDTNEGMFTVMCPITMQPNNNPKYDKLGGKTLYWLQDMYFCDRFFWGCELENILTEQEKLSQSIGDEKDLF